MDEAKVSKYRLSSKYKDYSLTHLMSYCAHFANEMLQLQFVCHSLGAEALTTTKYHAEYAEEGVEYSWGAAKALYRRHPLVSKKGRLTLTRLLQHAFPGMC